MKRFLIILFVLALLLTAVGCKKDEDSSGDDVSTVGDVPEIETKDASAGNVAPTTASSGTVTEEPTDSEEIDASELVGWLWRTEGDTVRELRLNEDGSFTFRMGDAESEFSQWVKGSWALSGSELSFQAWQADEQWKTLEGTQPFTTDYAVVYGTDTLALTRSDGSGLDTVEQGETLVFNRLPG